MILSWFKSKKTPPAALPSNGHSALVEQDGSVAALKEAFAQDPTSLPVCDALGAALLNSGDRHGARSVFEHVCRIAAQSAGAHNNLGAFLRDNGDMDAAIVSLAQAVKIDPRMKQAWDNLAATYFETGQLENAIEAYRKLVALPGAEAPTHLALGNALMAVGDADTACVHYRHAIRLEPEFANARWALAMAQIRPFYDNEQQVELSRSAFSSALAELDTWFNDQRSTVGAQAVGSTQPFYLAYHARNNLPLLTPYGNLCARLVQAGHEPQAKQVVPPLSARKLRVGFASAQVRNHSVWIAIAKGWIQHLDASRFEVHVFHLGRHADGETAIARAEATDFVDTGRTVQDWSQCIQDAQLDVLIFPEIGMDSLTTQLASRRLAPVQATSWGHPHTTGLPTIDFFLSAQALEPPLADAHYSEKLIRLPNLGVYVAPLAPTVITPDLLALGLPLNEPLLLCPGVPFKYRPEHDKLWATLALRLQSHGTGRIVFFGSHRAEFTKNLKKRLRRACHFLGVDFDKVVCFIPPQPRAEFFGLMQQSTLMLDTIGFSGFNTALQALECGLPIIAHEGEFMRGRLASALLRRLDLNDWVTTSNADFVEAAMQLVQDEPRRLALSQTIAQRRHILFNDLAPVRALEQFLLDAASKAAVLD